MSDHQAHHDSDIDQYGQKDGLSVFGVVPLSLYDMRYDSIDRVNDQENRIDDVVSQAVVIVIRWRLDYIDVDGCTEYSHHDYVCEVVNCQDDPLSSEVLFLPHEYFGQVCLALVNDQA